MFPVEGTFHPAEDPGPAGEDREESGEREQNFVHHGETEQRLEEKWQDQRERPTSSQQ